MRGLSNQLESLTHLRNALNAQAGDLTANRVDTWACEAVEQCLFWGGVFMENYAANSARRDPRIVMVTSVDGLVELPKMS